MPAPQTVEPHDGSMEFTLITLSPFKRRIVYVTLFEFFAILFSTLLLMLINGGAAHESLPVAIAVSLIAMLWNYCYNLIFESWEHRQKLSARTTSTRVIHAIGFEAGLLIFTLPIYMLWYAVGLWTAFSMTAALLIFFLFYTFIFTLVFDQFFTLPKRQFTIGN